MAWFAPHDITSRDRWFYRQEHRCTCIPHGGMPHHPHQPYCGLSPLGYLDDPDDPAPLLSSVMWDFTQVGWP